jgi:hypothetical protein
MNFGKFYQNKKNGRLIRYFIFIGLPLLVSFLLFPPLGGELSRYTDQKTGEVRVLVSRETAISPTVQDYIGSMLKIPLDIQRYQICFEDIGSYIEYYYKNKSTSKDSSTIEWTVNFNNLTNISLKSNSKSCISSIKSNENFTYNWEGTFIVTLASGYIINNVMTEEPAPAFKFVPNTVSYYIPEASSWAFFFIIVLISLDTIFYLATRIYKVIKDGFSA